MQMNGKSTTYAKIWLIWSESVGWILLNQRQMSPKYLCEEVSLGEKIGISCTTRGTEAKEGDMLSS
jgi:hypothetical protein